MSQFADFLNPEVIFSRDNPFLKSAAATHRLVFDTVEKTARAQLAFAEDLLEINRERFELLYAGKPLTETLDAQQELIGELGKRAFKFAGDLQEVAATMREGATEAAFQAANEVEETVERAAKSAKTKKAA